MNTCTPRFHGRPPRALTSALLSDAGIPHLFTTRHFPGVRPFSDPTGPLAPEALDGFAAHGVVGEDVAFLRQVHGADVVKAERGGLVGVADVLVTDRPGLPLAIFTADCLPIVICDTPGRRLAVAHSGWRGTVRSAARAAVSALVEDGGRPETMLAAIGPSIGPCCYEVDEAVIERLEAAFPGVWGDWVEAGRPGRWMLDLWKANEAQLIAAGLPPSQIDNPRLCTGCRAGLFFSYRRERDGGRLVTVAAIPDGDRPAC